MNLLRGFVALVLVPVNVWAQGTLQTWPGRLAANSPTVYVVDDAGVETSGKFLRVNPDSLVLLVNDREVPFEAARVRRIQMRGDSLRNGLIIGAVVGIGLGAVTAGMSDCPGDNSSGGCPGFRVAALAVSTAFYGGVGAGIDALIVGRTTVYDAQAARSRSGVLPSRERAAVTARLRW